MLPCYCCCSVGPLKLTLCCFLYLQLPEDADLSGITARFRDGVLTVMIKRTKPAEPETTDVPIDDWFDVQPGSGEQA